MKNEYHEYEYEPDSQSQNLLCVSWICLENVWSRNFICKFPTFPFKHFLVDVFAVACSRPEQHCEGQAAAFCYSCNVDGQLNGAIRGA